MVRRVLAIWAVCLAGCTYVGTRHVEQDMIERLTAISDRLRLGTSRDDVMNSFPAGEKQEWGRGVGVDDENVRYEEWRVYAEDLYGRPSPRWDRPPVAEEFRVFERWLYFVDGELYAVRLERDPLDDQDSVRLTWRRGGRYDPVGERISLSPADQIPGETTDDQRNGDDR